MRKQPLLLLLSSVQGDRIRLGKQGAVEVHLPHVSTRGHCKEERAALH